MPGKGRYDHSSSSKRLRCCPEPSSRYDPSILLLWVRSRSPLLRRLCLNVIREVGTYVCVPVLLPGLYRGDLYLVDLQTLKYRCVKSFTTKKGKRPIFHPIDCSAAIYMQCTRSGYLAYWLSFTTLKFTMMSGHTLSPIEPSICVLSGNIYVFRTNDVNEKYAVRHQEWYPIASLRFFTPISLLIPYKDRLYSHRN